MEKYRLVFLFLIFITATTVGQSNPDIKPALDFKKIYSFCLNADIRPALEILKDKDPEKLSSSDAAFKRDFENRFLYESDKSNSPGNGNPAIDKLLDLYLAYWRQALLNSTINDDTVLQEKVTRFLVENYTADAALKVNDDSIDVYLRKYIEAAGLHTTGFGKTGKLYDLLVWKTEKDTVYHFSSNGEAINARVVLMSDFVTLGWEEYATLGKYYPGGWATEKSLYCVAKGYDLASENFLISYLAHEGRHFEDYKLFPGLKSTDLEYRAKLTELGLASRSLYDLIDFFINNADAASENGHSVANYRVVRDLSKALFNKDFEINMDAWKKAGIPHINAMALRLLKSDSETLERRKKHVP